MDPFRDDLHAAHEQIQRLQLENTDLAARVRNAEEAAQRANAGIPSGPGGRPAVVISVAVALAVMAGALAATVVYQDHELRTRSPHALAQ